MTNSMVILLFGKDGQVGWELQRSLQSSFTVVALGRDDCNLYDKDAVRAIVYKYKPNIIINAAAYTAVDQAETQVEKAQFLNAVFVGVLAEVACEINSWIIHYSTDYVFDGNKKLAYLEDDVPAPLSIYGLSKFAGEQAIQSCGGDYLIFRSSWVYSSRRTNFPLAILKKSLQQDKLDVVCDSIGAPTHAALIADITAIAVSRISQQLLTSSAKGIYHLSAFGATSWFDYARFLITQAYSLGWPLKLSADNINPVLQTSFNAAARRPVNSQLNTEKLCRQLNIELPLWQDQLLLWLSSINYKDLLVCL